MKLHRLPVAGLRATRLYKCNRPAANRGLPADRRNFRSMSEDRTKLARSKRRQATIVDVAYAAGVAVGLSILALITALAPGSLYALAGLILALIAAAATALAIALAALAIAAVRCSLRLAQ